MKINLLGTEFKFGFERFLFTDTRNSATVSFMTGSLADWDSIEIILHDGANGSFKVTFADAYTEQTVNFAQCLPDTYGRISGNLMLLKGSTFVDGENFVFYWSMYNFYQFGVTMPDNYVSAFRPAVVSYSAAGLHLSEDTKKAKYLEVRIGDISDVREIRDDLSVNIQIYLQALLEGVDRWKQPTLKEAGDTIFDGYDWIKKNGYLQDVSILVIIYDSKMNFLAAGEKIVKLFDGLSFYPDEVHSFVHENGYVNRGWMRRRTVYTNLPCTIDLAGKNTKELVGCTVVFSRDVTINGNAYAGFGNGAKASGNEAISVDVMGFIANLREIYGAGFPSNSDITGGKIRLKLEANEPVLSDSQTPDKTKAGVVLDFNTCSEGAYLRWISTDGERCYHLFYEGQETIKTENEKEFTRVRPSYRQEQVRQIKRTRKIKVADSVRAEYVNFVRSIADGRQVQYYDLSKYKWVDVTINPVTFSGVVKPNGNLVEVEVVFPDESIKI